MSSLGQIACVFFSFMGSIYCLWIICDCWKQPRASREASEVSPGRPRRKAIADRIQWHCQLLLAGTFLAGAVVLITGNVRQLLSHLAQNSTGSWQSADPVVRALREELPAMYFDYDSRRPGRPILGIDCGREPVSDELLRELLHDASELDWLTLSGTQISDDLLRDLSQLPHLRHLNLDDTEITDSGLGHLTALKRLEHLSLDGTKITDAGLRHLAELKNLKLLWLGNTAITDRGLEHVSVLKHLGSLSLDGTRITDDGLRHLKTLSNLKVLELRNTAITDRGLEHVQYLEQLGLLELGWSTRVTGKGLDRLMDGLPRLRIR